MKTIFGTFFLALFILFGNVATAQEVGIQFFKGTWEEVKAEAKKQNKPIFVDAYAVWCGPCKYMDKNIFTDKSVGDYYNKNFVNYKFDMEKGEGPGFARIYKVGAYPTLLYIEPSGKVVHKEMGAKPVDAMIAAGKAARAKFDSNSF